MTTEQHENALLLQKRIDRIESQIKSWGRLKEMRNLAAARDLNGNFFWMPREDVDVNIWEVARVAIINDLKLKLIKVREEFDSL
tara:strand:- start:294 stop:545 length:252 start_codon:yes stop_codon:yes gene_type:complete